MRILLTGGAGFIGSNLVRRLLESGDGWEIVNLDLLTYAGSLANLDGLLEHPAHHFVRGDICDRALVRALLSGTHPDAPGPVEAVVNLAAESHVDRSIAFDEPFTRTNVSGVQVLLSEARAAGVTRFLQAGTDEVYGDLPWEDPQLPGAGEGGTRWRHGADGVSPAPDGFTESDPLRPSSPYSASKAAADLLVLAYHRTFGPSTVEGGMDVVVTRSSNTYGPRQHGEKLIPTLLRHALDGTDLPLYGDGLHIRDWLYVDDHCEGLVAALRHGEPGEVYNLGGASERTNRQVARAVLGCLDTHCAPRIGAAEDRKGHDRRYAVDFGRARDELGWTPSIRFEEGLRDTVSWYRDHPARLRSQGWRAPATDSIMDS